MQVMSERWLEHSLLSVGYSGVVAIPRALTGADRRQSRISLDFVARVTTAGSRRR
jgi:hypothetical protein